MMEGLAKLCELPWFSGLHRRIYDVLAVEGMLPDPCEIRVLAPEDVEADERVRGACWKDTKILWFREQPPDPITFAHELLHLIEKGDLKLEEVYAYNLSALVVLMAEEGVVPPANPVRLFEASADAILEAINETYKFKFSSLAEYFLTIGVVPYFVHLAWEGDSIQARGVREGLSEREVAIEAVSELAAGALYDRYMFEALLRLLGKLARRGAVGGGGGPKGGRDHRALRMRLRS